MKINNPFKSIRKKITDSREQSELRETERMVNHNVYVGNDPCVTSNEVGIDEVAEVLKNIKDMYRNSLNNKPIRIKRTW